jgi:hypothetical protein
LPFASFTEPIDIANVPEEVLHILTQIGFRDRNDLIEQLLSRENPMAKIFVGLLMKTTDLDQLPWDTAQSGPMAPIMPMEASMPSREDTLSESSGFPNESQIPESPSLGSCSFDALPLWDDRATSPLQILATQTFETTGITMWSVMTTIQYGLAKLPYLWFHPNSRLLYVRSIEANSYYSVAASFRTQADVTVTVYAHKGDNDDSMVFFNALRSWFG